MRAASKPVLRLEPLTRGRKALSPSLIWACSKNKDLQKGSRIHNELQKRGLVHKNYSENEGGERRERHSRRGKRERRQKTREEWGRERELEGMRQGEIEFKTELAIMVGIHHYNLLQLMGYCLEGADRRLLVYKYMENGSLDQWLFASSGATMPQCNQISSGEEDSVKGKEAIRLQWGLRYSIAVCVAKGLAYLHEGCEKHILHLDVKPQNILLDENFVAKVADFGLARGMEREESHVVTTMRGTPGYLAPEWIKDGTIDVKCDVFGFGMLLMEIVSGRKNADSRQTKAPYYPEWAYSQIVTNKLLLGITASDNLSGPNMNESLVTGSNPLFSAINNLMSPNSLHSTCSIDGLTDAKIQREQERA